MKMKRILSAAMAAAVAGSIAISASANFDSSFKKDCVNGLDIGGNWLLPLYARANEETGKPEYNHNIDLSKVGSAVFTLVVNEADRELFDGAFGGAGGASIHVDNIPEPEGPIPDEEKTYDGSNGKCGIWDWYNWFNGKQYWGVIDTGAKNAMAYDIDGVYMEGELKYIHTIDAETKPLFLETVEPYTYRIKVPIANPIADGKSTVEDVNEFRVYLQMWGADSFDITVTRCAILDTDGKAMIAFDKLGNVIDTNADDEKDTVVPETPPEDFDPGFDEPTTPESSAPAADSTPADSTPAASTPAASTPAASSAPAASSSSSSSDGLPTGAIVGIIAGVVAVIAVVVVVVVKKKKG